MSFTKTETTQEFWGICGLGWGLYKGTHRTRKQAIDAHIIAEYGDLKDRSARWKECREMGDRATRLTITYEWKL